MKTLCPFMLCRWKKETENRVLSKPHWGKNRFWHLSYSGKSYYKAKRTKPTTIYLSGNHSQKLQRRPSIPKKKTSSTTRLSAKNEIVSLVALINYNCCLRRIHKRGLSTGHATSTYQQGSFCRMVRKENSCYVKGNFSSPLKKPCELFLYFKELL